MVPPAVAGSPMPMWPRVTAGLATADRIILPEDARVTPRRTSRVSIRIAALAAALVVLLAAPAGAVSLKAVVDAAGPAGGYDKWVELEPGVVYTGGLLVGPIYNPFEYGLLGEPGYDLRIVGNGAVLDLQGGQICVSFCTNRLDIDDCVVINGGVRFRSASEFGIRPEGSVSQVTFYAPYDYAVRLQGAGGGISIERCIVVDPVDTGPDFVYTTGFHTEWLPTGTAISASAVTGSYGVPTVRQNWTFHSNPAANGKPLTHYSFLCEYG